MSSSELHAAARRILAAGPWGFLTTEDPPVRTRVVQHLEVTDDLTITFSTGPHTRKAESIRRKPAVIYAALDPVTGGAVSVHGQATLDDDPTERQRLWIDDLAPFFPAGPTGDGFVLVRIVPLRIEVWSVVDDMSPPPFGLSSLATGRSDPDDAWSGPTGTHP